MTPKPRLLLCLLACATLPGCTLCQNAKRTILREPSDFSWMADRKESLDVYRSWADRAWSEQYCADPEQPVSGAYVAGFKDGFVDLVFAGGSGEPPPVPPRPFWNVDVRNPRGHTEATDWFAGFRHGSQVAREEGHRERALVPSSLFLFGALEDGCEVEPCYREPFADSIAQPLQPEFVLPGQPQPGAGAEVTEPKLPKLSNPAAEMPSIDVPSLGIPEVEKLPQPPIVPEKGPIPRQQGPQQLGPQQPPAPQQSAPIQSPLERVRPPSDPPTTVDDIFGSSASVQRPKTVRHINFENVIRREVPVRQARPAFASALRIRSVAAKKSSIGRSLNSSRDGHAGHQKRVETAAKTATIPGPRAASIPKSDDQAKEMFHRLSQ